MILMANQIEEMMDTAMSNIKSMVDVNTVIGTPITAPDGTVIIPVSTVSFGFGAGGSEFGSKNKGVTAVQTDNDALFGGGCGGGANVKPVAFLVVGNGTMKLMPVTPDGSPVNRMLDLVPDVMNKVNGIISDFSDKREKKKTQEKDKPDTKNSYVDVAE